MKQHRFAIVLVVIIGSIVGLPHILIPRIIAPQKYDPLQFVDGKGSSITMEEVYTYVPEVREILEGKFWVTDTQVAEYNGQSTPFVGETGLAWVMAFLAKITGSIENAFIMADFLFPAITFLLVYAIVTSLLKNKIIAITSGAVVVLWPELMALFPYPQTIVSSIKATFNPRDFLFISRNFHPQLSLAAYLLALWCLLRLDLAAARSNLFRAIAAGAAVGFLFYTYIFNWTAFGLGLSIFGFFAVCKTFRREVSQTSRYWYLKHLLIIAAIAAVLAAPYFLQVWYFRQSGLAEDFFLKLSLPKRDFFGLTARHWVFVLLFLIVNWKKVVSSERSESRDLAKRFRSAAAGGLDSSTPLRCARNDGLLVFLCMWIGVLILPDLAQGIFGRDLEGKHWIRRIAYPMSIMGLGLIAGEIKRKWVNAAAGLVLIGVLVYGILVQVNMSRKAAFAYAVDQEKQKLYEFINTKLPPGAVVASLDWETIVNIPAKTHAFNFSPIGMRTIASTDETLDRFLWLAALYGKSEDWVREAFGDNGIGTTRVYYFMYANDETVFRTPPDKVEEIVFRYQDIRQELLAGEKPPFRLMLQLEK